jgi:hypothetical protein
MELALSKIATDQFFWGNLRPVLDFRYLLPYDPPDNLRHLGLNLQESEFENFWYPGTRDFGNLQKKERRGGVLTERQALSGVR